MKKLLILGGSLLQLPAIKIARRLGYYVIVADADPTAVGFEYANKSLLISTLDKDALYVSASELKVNGIMTLATDMPVRSVAYVAEKMNLEGVSIETSLLATNKFKMRERLRKCKVPIPDYFKASNRDDYYSIINKLSCPFIVKPVDNSGGRGIYLVRSKEEAKKAFDFSVKYSRGGEILVEEFMKGREVSVESLSIHGKVRIIAITDKLTSGPPFFVEIGHSQPAVFNKSIIEAIKRTATKAIKAIGIENGPSHTEIMVTMDGPKIVEIGARLGGGFITSHLVPLSTGVDMIQSCIKIALKEDPEYKVKFQKASAVRFFKTHHGKIHSISGIEEAELVNGVYEIGFFKKIGETINDLQNGTDRIGYIISQGESVKEAINSCERAMNIIDISIV